MTTREDKDTYPTLTHDPLSGTLEPCSGGLRFEGLVATARGNTPDPIPNSAVKTLSANGTVSQDTGE